MALTNLLTLIFILVISGKYVLMQQTSRYSISVTESGALVKGNFFQAQLHCKQTGKQVPTPDTEEKMTEMLNFFEENSIVRTWISATDLADEGDFYWFTSGRPLNYSFWHVNQPDNANNAEHCVQVVPIYHDIRWNDADCSIKGATIICEDLD